MTVVDYDHKNVYHTMWNMHTRVYYNNIMSYLVSHQCAYVTMTSTNETLYENTSHQHGWWEAYVKDICDISTHLRGQCLYIHKLPYMDANLRHKIDTMSCGGGRWAVESSLCVTWIHRQTIIISVTLSREAIHLFLITCWLQHSYPHTQLSDCHCCMYKLWGH